ncbi:MAG: hypothetical protein SGJ00_02680 [bacterium]|nr:hypothetical protein [bacterium]
MSLFKFGFLGACALLLVASCAPSRIIKPLAKGEQAVGANFGGPLINFVGIPITIPYTSAFYAKGLNNKTTAFGSVHLTALAFGVFQTDIGMCRALYKNEKYKLGLTANPALNFAIDRWEWKAKVWPQLDVNVYKEIGSNKMFYVGLCNWFELSKLRAHNEIQPKHWYMNPQFGFQYSPKKWTYGIECKWVAPNVPNQPNIVDYMGPNHKGAIGVYFQFVRKF